DKSWLLAVVVADKDLLLGVAAADKEWSPAVAAADNELPLAVAAADNEPTLVVAADIALHLALFHFDYCNCWVSCRLAAPVGYTDEMRLVLDIDSLTVEKHHQY